MKKIKLVILLMILTISVFSQNSKEVVDSLTADVCLKRGHVADSLITETKDYCEPYVVDLDTMSVLVYPSCNAVTYKCRRCKKIVTEKVPEKYYIVWTRPKE